MTLRQSPHRPRFWFGQAQHATRGEWFRKDRRSTRRSANASARRSPRRWRAGSADWCADAHGALARVIVLDQFTRNVYRDTPRAFAGDARALATRRIRDRRGFERDLDGFERWFLYCRSSTRRTSRCRSARVVLFRRLAEDTGERSPLEWAEKHAASDPPLRALSPPQRSPRPRVNARGDRVPAGTRFALLTLFCVQRHRYACAAGNRTVTQSPCPPGDVSKATAAP